MSCSTLEPVTGHLFISMRGVQGNFRDMSEIATCVASRLGKTKSGVRLVIDWSSHSCPILTK